MERDLTIKVPQYYTKLSTTKIYDEVTKEKKHKLKWCLSILVLATLAVHSIVFVWCLKSDVEELQKKVLLLETKAEVDIQIMKNLQNMIYSRLKKEERLQNPQEYPIPFEINEPYDSKDEDERQSNEETSSDENDYVEETTDESSDENLENSDEHVNIKSEESEEIKKFRYKRKREIRDYNDSSVERDFKVADKTEAENKFSTEKSLESERKTIFSKDKSLESAIRNYVSTTHKPHPHKKHRKPRIGSAERFFLETHSTTSAPIQVRQSRTKHTQLQGIDKTLWLQSQKLQQHTSPSRDTITKEEALRKGYGKRTEDASYELEASREQVVDALYYNMIMIHFSADTSHYSRERDPHYFGNGRMQIKSEVYKDWKPAHWTQGVGMSKYFFLHQGRVTVSTTGIYLIYAQIQYSNVQEVNGFSVFRNKEVVVQCITTSTHPDKHEIKSNTCGISTTILLQSNDSVCIKDLHHGRYVVLTPEKSYFGLVLLSLFKN